MAHGWVSRGDLKDEKVVQDSQEAMAKAITFLKSNVPTVPVVVTIIVKFKDSPKFWAYVEGHAPILTRHGGKIVAVMPPGVGEMIEGSKECDVLVNQEFPSAAAYDNFYSDPEYQPWKKMRQEAADCTVYRMPKQLDEGQGSSCCSSSATPPGVRSAAWSVTERKWVWV